MNGTLKGTIRPKVVLKGTISRTIEKIESIVQALEVTENGKYSAPEGVHGFNPVNVNVPLRYDEGYTDGYQASQDNITLQEKTITENGEYETDEGFTGMSKVTVAVPIKGEQEKTVEITKNGTTEVVADKGKTLSKVTVNVNVASEGNVGNTYIDTAKMEYFSYFFSKNPLLLDDIDRVDTSNGVDFGYMFYNCSELQTIPNFDVKNGVNFAYMFYGCSNLQSTPLLNTSNGTSFNYMFYNCSNLQSISKIYTSKGKSFANMFTNCVKLKTAPDLDTAKGTSFANMFKGCTNLISVALTTATADFATTSFQDCTALQNITIGKGWAVSIYLNYSENLPYICLHRMIENLADRTGMSAKKFQVGEVNLKKIDDYHLDMLESKNWNYS